MSTATQFKTFEQRPPKNHKPYMSKEMSFSGKPQNFMLTKLNESNVNRY